MISRLRQGLSKYLRRNIYFVSDGGQWSFYWDTHYLMTGLQKRHHLPVYTAQDVWGLRRQLIQFVSRYAYLHGDFKRLHPSNRVFLTWYHGNLNDPNPDIQRILALLPQAEPYLTRINVSCRISKDVLRQIGIPDAKLVTIPIGVDLKTFVPPSGSQRQQARQAFGIPDDALCIGSFQKDGQGWDDGITPKPAKGPDIFLETVAVLARHYPKLIVFLTGPARGYVKQGLEKIGVPTIHHLLNDYPEIVRCYHALDLYLITSRSEGGPKALMESWATGVPLVSTRMGMPADWMRHGENGMLADVDDVTVLVEGARALIEDAALRERCRQRGFEDVKALDWSRIVDLYYAMYKPFL